MTKRDDDDSVVYIGEDPPVRLVRSQAELDGLMGAGFGTFPEVGAPVELIDSARAARLRLFADSDRAVVRLLSQRANWQPWEGSLWFRRTVQDRRWQIWDRALWCVVVQCAFAIGVCFAAAVLR